MPISSFYGLQTSLRGLLAQQRLLDTAGHNIANASTKGYSRQEASLVASPALEIPAGGTEPVTQPDGPTPGSVAREGGGGDYLSNEIAYRATLLRDALGLDIPGGHLHTPVLQFSEGNRTELTDPVFEANQRDIINQVRNVLVVAAGTL